MRFDQIDAALEGVEQYGGKAYFFREGAYVRYEWKLDREDFATPSQSRPGSSRRAFSRA